MNNYQMNMFNNQFNLNNNIPMMMNINPFFNNQINFNQINMNNNLNNKQRIITTNLNLNEKEFIIKFKINESEKILIECDLKEEFLSLYYHSIELSLEDFHKLGKSFKLCDNINEIFNLLDNIIKSIQLSFNDNNNKIESKVSLGYRSMDINNDCINLYLNIPLLNGKFENIVIQFQKKLKKPEEQFEKIKKKYLKIKSIVYGNNNNINQNLNNNNMGMNNMNNNNFGVNQMRLNDILDENIGNNNKDMNNMNNNENELIIREIKNEMEKID